MEHRGTPVRKPHTSTADLLTWPENPSTHSSDLLTSNRPVRDIQPSDGIKKVVFGGQVTDEEFESLLIRKPCSENKRKEMTGSGIFAGKGKDDGQEADDPNTTPTNKTGVRIYQQTLEGMSQISFTPDETHSPKKRPTLPEAAKQRELSGNLNPTTDPKLKKQFSNTKHKELSGNNVFAPPPEIKVRDVQPSPAFRVSNSETVVKTAKKIHDQKFAHLSGNNVFKDDTPVKNYSVEKGLSSAKLREMSGNDIFSDGKAESRDYYTGVRKPPGGESSIDLV